MLWAEKCDKGEGDRKSWLSICRNEKLCRVRKKQVHID